MHFAGAATARAERSWFASASGLILEAARPVSAALVLRAFACGAPLLPIQDGPVAATIAAWLAHQGGASPPAPSFGVEAIARLLERGEAVQRAIEDGKRIAARHEAEVVGARWKVHPTARRRAA